MSERAGRIWSDSIAEHGLKRWYFSEDAIRRDGVHFVVPLCVFVPQACVRQSGDEKGLSCAAVGRERVLIGLAVDHADLSLNVTQHLGEFVDRGGTVTSVGHDEQAVAKAV